MLYFNARQSPEESNKKKNKLKVLIATVIYIIGLICIPNMIVKLIMVILFPLEYYFVQNHALKMYPKLISFQSDHLVTAKSICNSNLIITDMNHLINYHDSRITHVETLDLEVTLSENMSEVDLALLKRKNLTKLIQTALLCDHEDERLTPPFDHLKSLLPLDENALSSQWPTLRSWQSEGLWLTQHQETKTHMTQLMCMGDLDQLLERCTHVLTQNGIDILKKEHVAKIIASEHRHGHELERVWGYAFKIDTIGHTEEDTPSDLIYIGAISVFATLKSASINEAHKVITFSPESPVYVTAIAKHLGLFNEENRVFDHLKLKSFSNQTLSPILHRYAFLTRFNEDQTHRLLSLYRKREYTLLKTSCSIKSLSQIDPKLIDFFVNQTYDQGLFSKAFIESNQLTARFDKLKAYMISIHLVELIAITSLLKASPYLLLGLNFIISYLLGLALFVEPIDSSTDTSSHSNNKPKVNNVFRIISISTFVGLYSLMISLSSDSTMPLLFMGYLFVGMAFMFQYTRSISLRKIAFKQTPLNATSGMIILLFIVVTIWEIKTQFELQFLAQFIMSAMTPMILHDLLKLSRFYIHKFSKPLKH